MIGYGVRLTLAALAALFTVGVGVAAAPAAAAGDVPFAPVLPGYAMNFPRDFGSHPAFRTEWWYLTGWLQTDRRETLGFQITFFRVATAIAGDNPSAFAPRQLLIAHCAISDPQHGRLWTDQRIRRAGLGLAEALQGDTQVWIDDWRLSRDASGYHASVPAGDFMLDLQLRANGPPMLNGDAGYSRKGPAAAAASEYYSEPHLTVSGRVLRARQDTAVQGEAWLDHEWSSEYLAPGAVGWDWVGLNLPHGGAVMAFQIRGPDGRPLWAGATERDASGRVHSDDHDQVAFAAGRRWRSARTGVTYPIGWRIRLGNSVLDIVPFMDDQEHDARESSGALYWEGAVRAFEAGRLTGQGYLELTGYGGGVPLR